MEDDKIHVVERDGSGENSELSDLLDRWRIPAAAVLGLLVVVVFLVSAQRGTDAPPSNSPEALPVVSTTQPTSTTTSIPATTTPPTTTTIALGQVIRDAAAFMVSDVRDFCVRASPFGTNRIPDADEWIESLSHDDWLLKLGDSLEGFERKVSEAGAALDWYRRNLLNSVPRDLRLADEALRDALYAMDDGDPDEWAYHVARVESSCARASATIVAMLAMSAE